jgi:hypothetical protein
MYIQKNKYIFITDNSNCSPFNRNNEKISPSTSERKIPLNSLSLFYFIWNMSQKRIKKCRRIILVHLDFIHHYSSELKYSLLTTNCAHEPTGSVSYIPASCIYYFLCASKPWCTGNHFCQNRNATNTVHITKNS